MRVLGRYFLTILLASVGVAAGLVLLTRPARAIVTATRTDPQAAQLQLNQLSQRSVVYDRNGGVIAVLHADENRSPIALGDVPKHVVDAILDVEDDTFYEHNGVNVRAVLRAAITNAESGEVRQGGSTITQQLVKQQLLTPERSIGRKVKEAVLAVRLEEQMSKDDILEEYLNTVYFGNGAYGVQAAAEVYFGKGAKDLMIEEGAFLAGIINNPVRSDPFRQDRPEFRQRAEQRRRFALDRMVERGHLTPAQRDLLDKVPLPTVKHDVTPTRDDYFVEEVKQRLLDDRRLGETETERYNAVFRGGLRIETTFDPAMQGEAEKAVRENLPDPSKRRYRLPDGTVGTFTAALVTVEPKSGAVRAMVAGDNFEEAKYNLATGRGGFAGRQPGSSFKPFVLAAALENGYGPNDTIAGTEPCPVRMEGIKPNPYEPGNYEGSRGSNGPIWQAIAKSLNCAFVRLGLSLDSNPYKSLDKVAETARRLGLRIPEGQYGPSISLGSKEVWPIEMAAAYATFANDGVRNEPYFVQRVVDRNGKVLFEHEPEPERVIEPNVARSVTWSLQKVVQGGTGTRARLPGRQVAGKTGTAQNHQDAWFVGYTPQLATAVWMGAAVGQEPMNNVGGIRVTGGSYPARIWGAYMKAATAGMPVEEFADPNLNAFGKAKAVKVPKEAGGGSTRRPTTKRTAPTTTAPEPDVRTSIAEDGTG